MEDNKIKSMLQGFQPELLSDQLFMMKLQRSLDAVEIVKQQNAQLRRRCRIAVAVAAASGFVAGVVLTLLFPIISAWVSSITITLPSLGIQSINFDGAIITWMLIAITCIVIAMNAYELALSQLSTKTRH